MPMIKSPIEAAQFLHPGTPIELQIEAAAYLGYINECEEEEEE